MMLSRFLPVLMKNAMNFAMNFLKRLVFMRPVCECSANVIVLTHLKILKGQFLLPFFFTQNKNLQ
jgi:hypothetical protein